MEERKRRGRRDSRPAPQRNRMAEALASVSRPEPVEGSTIMRGESTRTRKKVAKKKTAKKAAKKASKKAAKRRDA